MSEKQKIELQLDLKTYQKVEIISKTFRMSIPDFLLMNIKKDIKYIIECFKTDRIVDLADQFSVFFSNKDIQKIKSLEEDK